jgi:hypothetical protein
MIAEIMKTTKPVRPHHHTPTVQTRTGMVLCVALFVMMVLGLVPAALRAQYRLAINPALFTPVGQISSVVQPTNPGFSFSMYRYTRQIPFSIGGSVGFQFFDSQPERKGKDYTYEVLAFPLLFGAQFNLLPEFFLNPYYGLEAGAMFFRYRVFAPDMTTTAVNNIAIVLVPQAGFRITILDDLMLDVSVRYQYTLHEQFRYGPTDEYRTQGFTALGWMLGLSVPVNGRY